MIRYFGGMKKLFKIHFRNVSAPLPHFTETMIDDGYYDMSKIMKGFGGGQIRWDCDPRSCSGFGE